MAAAGVLLEGISLGSKAGLAGQGSVRPATQRHRSGLSLNLFFKSYLL